MKLATILTYISLFGLFLLAPILVPDRLLVHAAVVINEIVPKTDPSTLEWVELYNTDSQSVSLNQWKLDHTADSSSYILNASAIIQPHGFLLLAGSQTNISFSINGDTIRLFDQNNAPVDSQSYPGTLGYNTSMGRTSDGDGVWALCTTATPNTNNVCPTPSPTATPMPTPTPYPIATPFPTPTLMPTPTLIATTPTPQTFGSLLPTPTGPQVLGATASVTPIPTQTQGDIMQLKIRKTWIAYGLLAIAAAALSYMLVLWLRRRQRKTKT